MLVLSRYKDESVIIDLSELEVSDLPLGKIVVQVVEIRGDKVRLGFTAQRSIPIHREEVFDRIHGQMETANATLESGGSQRQTGD